MMMKVHVQLFAVAKQLAGRETVEIELPDRATVADLRRELPRQAPALAGIISQLKFAVDEEYARDDTPLSEKSGVACIPPVSGG
jgi:molybdopterin converting factor subunit 1